MLDSWHRFEQKTKRTENWSLILHTFINKYILFLDRGPRMATHRGTKAQCTADTMTADFHIWSALVLLWKSVSAIHSALCQLWILQKSGVCTHLESFE